MLFFLSLYAILQFPGSFHNSGIFWATKIGLFWSAENMDKEYFETQEKKNKLLPGRFNLDQQIWQEINF